MTDFAVRAPIAAQPPRRSGWHRHLHGSELVWALAFVLPYAAVFLALVAYPMAYGLWLGARPELFAELVSDPRYLRSLANTLIFVTVAVNVKMVAALFLSGFFMRRRKWIKALLPIYILPWTLPAVPAYLSFHWMLVGPEGLLDQVLYDYFGINGPVWFNSRGLALTWNIVAYIWKWMPLWTLIFLAGRLSIPQDLLDAAEIDGAGLYRRFRHVILPLLANLYFISTLISTIWTFGDFTTVFIVSGGAPAMASDVLSTLALQYALDLGNPPLGIAMGLTAVPLMIVVVVMLMRRLRKTEVQL